MIGVAAVWSAAVKPAAAAAAAASAGSRVDAAATLSVRRGIDVDSRSRLRFTEINERVESDSSRN